MKLRALLGVVLALFALVAPSSAYWQSRQQVSIGGAGGITITNLGQNGSPSSGNITTSTTVPAGSTIVVCGQVDTGSASDVTASDSTGTNAYNHVTAVFMPNSTFLSDCLWAQNVASLTSGSTISFGCSGCGFSNVRSIAFFLTGVAAASRDSSCQGRGSDTAAGTSVTANSVSCTIAASGEQEFFVVATSADASSLSVPNYTSQISHSTGIVRVMTRSSPPTGAQSDTGTLGIARTWNVQQFAFK